MSLVVNVTVNEASLVGRVIIQRFVHVGTEPDDVNGYRWSVESDDGIAKAEMPLMHRYGDGAMVLLAKVMQAWEAGR